MEEMAGTGCGDGGTVGLEVGDTEGGMDAMVARMFLQTIWHPL